MEGIADKCNNQRVAKQLNNHHKVGVMCSNLKLSLCVLTLELDEELRFTRLALGVSWRDDLKLLNR